MLFLSNYLATSVHAIENPLAYRPLPIAIKQPVIDKDQNFLVKGVMWPLSFYATVLSRVDGDRCPSCPNCSLYSQQAFRRHGAVLGLWMTVDRLIHERTDIIQAQKARFSDGRLCVLDPLDGNDRWLRGR